LFARKAPIVLSREPDRAERCRIGSQPVGYNPARRKAVLLKHFTMSFLRLVHPVCAGQGNPAPHPRCRPPARASTYRRGLRSPFHQGANDRSVAAANGRYLPRSTARTSGTTAGLSRRMRQCRARQQFLDIPKGQCEPGIEPDRVADDFWREAVALKRYRSHRMMLIGDEPQSYPSYRDIAVRELRLAA